MTLRRSSRLTAKWLKEKQLEASLNDDWAEYLMREELKKGAVEDEDLRETPEPQSPKPARPPAPNSGRNASNHHPHAGNDNFNTPAEAWELAKGHLLKGRQEEKVWQPFYNDGAITSTFKNSIHIKKDFFTYEPDEWDCVIDNPPYTNKREIIENLLEKGKPFALLIPASSMMRAWWYKLKPSSRDLTIIIPKSCYLFKGKEKSIRVETAWFCWGFKLGREVIYEGEELMAGEKA